MGEPTELKAFKDFSCEELVGICIHTPLTKWPGLRVVNKDSGLINLVEGQSLKRLATLILAHHVKVTHQVNLRGWLLLTSISSVLICLASNWNIMVLVQGIHNTQGYSRVIRTVDGYGRTHLVYAFSIYL
jgi:hypothetical protein